MLNVSIRRTIITQRRAQQDRKARESGNVETAAGIYIERKTALPRQDNDAEESYEGDSPHSCTDSCIVQFSRFSHSLCTLANQFR